MNNPSNLDPFYLLLLLQKVKAAVQEKEEFKGQTQSKKSSLSDRSSPVYRPPSLNGELLSIDDSDVALISAANFVFWQ